MRSLNPTSTTSRNPSPSRSDFSSPDTPKFPKSTSVNKTSREPSTAPALRVKPRITPSTTSTRSTRTTTTASATSASSSTTASSRQQNRLLQPTVSSSHRAPLRSRDHNVLNQSQAARPSSTLGKTRPTDNMPPPHHEKGAAAGSNPRQPALAPSAAKALGRPPLTPKIASKSQPVVTPLARRRTETSATGSAAVAHEHLGNNITPRSGHRQSRVDSTNTTPNGTPDPNHDHDGGSRASFFDTDHQAGRKHVVTFSPPQDAARNDTPDSKFFYASDARGSSQAPKPPPVQQQQQQQPKGPMFRYADGSAVGRGSNNNSRPTSPGVSTGGFTPMLAATQDTHQPNKFFHANGAAPDLQPAFRPTSAASGTGSAVSSAQKMAGPRIAPASSTRPVSPIKQPQSQVGGMQPQQPQYPNNTRNNISSPPQLGPAPGGRRRVSIEAGSPQPQPSPHSRSGSVTSGDAMIMSKFMASQTLLGGVSEGPSSPQPSQQQTQQFPSQPQPQAQNPAMTMASIIQAAEDFEAQQSEESKNQSEVQSPTKSHSGDPLNELVANARRERKVQDLEIRNTSLEAINRSLERQLRKQTNELRRYRRLSRSGRLSLASMASSRIPSDSTVATTDTLDGMSGGAALGAMGLSDLDEEDGFDDDFADEDDDDSLYDTDPSEGASAASPLGANADRRRQRDEKRLQLDLSKHRELLVDSQKINQSIKRCLNWTEELISEGRKALDYHVRVSDVDLAPRVLAPQYEDEEDEDGVGDVSRLESEIGDEGSKAAAADPNVKGSETSGGASLEQGAREPLHGLGLDGAATLPTISTSDETTPASTATADAPTLKGANLAPPWGKDAQDRDSGVELPVDGG